MIVTTVLAAQYAGTLDLSDTTRIGLRSTYPAPIVNTSATAQGRDVLAADATTSPAAHLHAYDPHWDYALGYSPTLTAAAVELGFEPQTIHAGAASIGWHGRFVRVSVTEGASYGRFNSAFLYAQPTAQQLAAGPAGSQPATTGPQTPPMTTTTAPQAVPKTTTIDFGASSTTASITAEAAKRTTLFTSGGYTTSGGLTADAKLVLPQQYGPLASVGAFYASSRSDTFSTMANASDLTTSGFCPPPPGQVVPAKPTKLCVVDTPTAQIQEALRHAISGTETLSVSVGAFAAVATTPYVKEAVIGPSAGVIFVEQLSVHKADVLSISAGLTPAVDLRTGFPSNRGQLAASLGERLAPHATLLFSAGFVQSIPVPVKDPYALTDLTGGLDVLYHLDRQVDVGVGVQALWQNQAGYGNVFSLLGYVNMTARLPTLHF